MNCRTSNFVRCGTVLTLFGLAAAGSAAPPTALMPVSARILPRTDLTVQSPAALVISADDVRRGFWHSGQPLRLTVLSNHPTGMELDLQAPGGLFKSIRIDGQQLHATLPGDGGTIVWRWQPVRSGERQLDLDLDLTFELQAEQQPGSLSWPVIVSGRPLLTGVVAQ
jgi:predicted secreted protein